MTPLRRRREDENCWCGALAGEACLAIKAGFPMSTYTHMITETRVQEVVA